MSDHYWRVKSASLERTLALERLTAQAQQVDAAFAAVMRANGLDPTKNYRLTDADESVIEVDPLLAKEP